MNSLSRELRMLRNGFKEVDEPLEHRQRGLVECNANERSELTDAVGKSIAAHSADLIKMANEENLSRHFLQLLGPFTGKEGSSEANRFFNSFEILTSTWRVEFRAVALGLKLRGKAKMIYDSLPDDARNDYSRLKSALISGLSSDYSVYSALNKLMSGIPQSRNESIGQFANRLEKLVRASLSKCKSEDQVLISCKAYFTRYLSNPKIAEALLMASDELQFRELVLKASALQER